MRYKTHALAVATRKRRATHTMRAHVPRHRDPTMGGLGRRLCVGIAWAGACKQGVCGLGRRLSAACAISRAALRRSTEMGPDAHATVCTCAGGPSL